MTMEKVVEDSYGDQRIAARLLQVFASAALLLCVAGLYSLLVYLVMQRTQELGIRLALGAQPQQVIRLVLREAGWILCAGLAFGLTISVFASRMLAGMVFEVKPYDALTLTGASGLLLASGLAAAYIPARQAARVDPMQALRTQ
jgi:ABC-type antimicrobial peptide transport system permease subunit